MDQDVIVLDSQDQITLDNVIGLLDEVVHNGEQGAENIYAWFLGEKDLIKRTLDELEDIRLDLTI